MSDRRSSTYADCVIEAAAQVVKGAKARVVMAFVDAVPDLGKLASIFKAPVRLILIARNAPEREAAGAHTDKIVDVPDFDLTRMDQIKMATLLAFSQRLLKADDTFVFLVGPPQKPCDTMVVMHVGEEYEMFQTVDQPRLTEHVKRVVFQRVLTIALELANEGREGKPVGALFVLGNWRELEPFCVQNIINPFKGYTEKERNVLDDKIKDTVKEFSALDGAFIIKGSGVIVSTGTTLRPNISGEPLPQGLGARHATAAAMTASVKCVAITLSESDGTVRVWRRGQIITEIEKAPRHGLPKGGLG
ncbi:MAG: diadenylate cyclase [Phycisphaerales bacterium]|nr:MAG: diadenylate cyclase [Phycisphaerales bacterium]